MSNCKVCNKTETDTSLHQCSVCRKVTYCSRKCQQSDFSSHKPTCKKDGVLALLAAITDNNVDDVRRLMRTKYVLKGKVDYNPGDMDRVFEGWTALHQCVREDKDELLKILANAPGVKLEMKDGDGETPLFVAAGNANPRALQVLVDAGANPNAVGNDGWSAIMMAVRDARIENIEVLMKAGANIDIGQDMFGRRAVDLAMHFASGQGGVRMEEGETFEQARAKYMRVCELLYK